MGYQNNLNLLRNKTSHLNILSIMVKIKNFKDETVKNKEKNEFIEFTEHPEICYFYANIKAKEIICISPTIQNITGFAPGRFEKFDQKFLKQFIPASDLNRLTVIYRLFLFYGRQKDKEHSMITSFNHQFKIVTAQNLKKKIRLELKIIQYDAYGFPSFAIGEIREVKPGDNKPYQDHPEESEIPNCGISRREKEVLTLLAQGYSSKQIADKLFISDHTTMTHRKNLIQKFKVKNTAELIKEAAKSFVL